MKLDATAVVRAGQLADFADAMQGLLATKQDLLSIADLVERELPGMVERAAPRLEKCAPVPPSRWRFTIVRDPDTHLLSELVATPEPLA